MAWPPICLFFILLEPLCPNHVGKVLDRQWLNFPGKCVAVNSISGRIKELTPDSDKTILSRREHQVLAYIDAGKTSQEIADALMISKNTVSRHRQSILDKLQARNSFEACKAAKALSIL